jgi:MFS family permease
VWTLVVACFGVLLVIASMVALNTALPDIAMATSATQPELTWIVDSYTLVLACLLLPAGALGDRFGRRGALLFGLAVFAVASVAPAVWSDPMHLIIARGAAGAGAAFVMPATLSLLTAAYPKDQRNKAVGIWAGTAGSGAVIGMLGSGGLLYFWTWQSIFWAFAGAGLAMFLLTLTVATSKETAPKPLDWLGALVIGGGVAVLVFGILEAPTRGWSDPVVIGCIAAGFVLSLSFGAIELRRRHPLLDVRLFGNPAFATGAAAITVFFLAMFGYFYIAMQHLQLILGYSRPRPPSRCPRSWDPSWCSRRSRSGICRAWVCASSCSPGWRSSRPGSSAFSESTWTRRTGTSRGRSSSCPSASGCSPHQRLRRS